MKKRTRLILILCAISVGCIILWCLQNSQEKTISEKIFSNDYYSVVIETYSEADIDFITFHIEDNNNNIVYTPIEAWRKWDFKDIYFIPNTNNVYVYSADIGTTIYEFNGKTWEPHEVTYTLNIADE